MKRFLLIFKREFNETLKSKAFIFTGVFMTLILLALIIWVFLTSGSIGGTLIDTDSTDYIPPSGQSAANSPPVEKEYDAVFGVDDQTGLGFCERLSEQLSFYRFDSQSLDEDGIKQSIDNDTCDAYIVIDSPTHYTIYEDSGVYGSRYSEKLTAALQRFYRLDTLAALGVSGSDALDVLDTPVVCLERNVGGGSMAKYVFNYLMIVLMFLAIELYGQMVATRVATEKSSRTMELLSVSVSPVELLCGKVCGVGAAGLAQLLAFILCLSGVIIGLVPRSLSVQYMLGGAFDLTGLDVLWLCLYFVLGFLMVSFIYGGLGAMVSQVEDLSGLYALPGAVLSVGYIMSMILSSLGRPNILLTVASFMPFWSPMVMFSRMSVENVPVWQICLSLTLLTAFSAIMAVLSARLYRRGMLRYGKPPRIKELLQLMKK